MIKKVDIKIFLDAIELAEVNGTDELNENNNKSDAVQMVCSIWNREHKESKAVLFQIVVKNEEQSIYEFADETPNESIEFFEEVCDGATISLSENIKLLFFAENLTTQREKYENRYMYPLFGTLVNGNLRHASSYRNIKEDKFISDEDLLKLDKEESHNADSFEEVIYAQDSLQTFKECFSKEFALLKQAV